MYDFVIIGGGIAGVSAAARLSHLGTVIIVESEDNLAYHASGRSAAAFLSEYGNKVVRDLNAASADYLRDHNGGVLSPRGMMLLGRPEDDGFGHEAKEFGLRTLTMDEAVGMVPILNRDRTVNAAYREDVYDLDTDLLIQNFLREARANGAVVETKWPVAQIIRSDHWTLQRADGAQIEGRVLINAAGAWVDVIAQMAGVRQIGFKPMRRSMARIPAPAGLDVTHWPFMDAAAERWYAKPDAGQLIVSPSEEHLVEPHDAWADDMVLAEGLSRYEEMVTEPVTRLTSSWAGLRTFAPDRALVIGQDTSAPNFYWVAGQGGYGFQTAAAASQLLADLIGGRAPQLDAKTVAALSPARFDQ